MLTRAGQAHAAFEAFPRGGLADIAPAGGGILVLAPHPDDESLGCGGLIALAARAGRMCTLALLTDGDASHTGSVEWPRDRLARERRAEAICALDRLGHAPGRTIFLGLPDASVPSAGPGFDAAVGLIANRAVHDGCESVVAPWIEDPHCDHVATQLIAREVARRLSLRLWSYPVWGWLLQADAPLREPLSAPPRGISIDITPVLPRKRQAIAAHATQLGGVIVDAVSGFTLPNELLDACGRNVEILIETVP